MMQPVTRNKPYKAKAPLRTVNEIRSILEKLDIGTVEFCFPHLDSGVYSIRLTCGDSDLIETQIGTNGKGMNARYALASAYAEFMERLQNGILLPVRITQTATKQYLCEHPEAQQLQKVLEKRDLILEFLYDPDERYLSAEELCDRYGTIMSSLFQERNLDKLKEHLARSLEKTTVVCVPYLDMSTKEIAYLPQQILREVCGSNGMCAGNTPYEAVIQGVSEVYERYAIRMIYDKQLTPPEVPLSLFAGTEVAERLARLEQQGIIASVRDCSLGIGLPVIGLLLENTMNGRFAFHLGADPAPETALERCLTEVFQGQEENNVLRFHSRSESEGLSRRQLLRGYYEQLLTGCGVWPASIYSTEPSWEFTAFKHCGNSSDEEDLDYLLSIAQEHGSTLYLRNASHFGFPSFQVYLPGFSENDYVFEEGLADYVALAGLEKQRKTLWNLAGASEQDLCALSQAIEAVDQEETPVPLSYFTWFPEQANLALRSFPQLYLTTLIHACGKRFSPAVEAMEAFLASAEAKNGPLLFYRAQFEYWKMLAEGLAEDEIKEKLLTRFNEAIVMRVFALAQPENAFDKKLFSRCFECETCDKQGRCGYFAVLGLAKRLQGLQKESSVSTTMPFEIDRP